jgi:hypothetical protein
LSVSWEAQQRLLSYEMTMTGSTLPILSLTFFDWWRAHFQKLKMTSFYH